MLAVLDTLLTPDEKTILTELELYYSSNTSRITQKSLGHSLGWSKSKVSAVVSLLHQKSLVKKERVGKNYYIILSSTLQKNSD